MKILFRIIGIIILAIAFISSGVFSILSIPIWILTGKEGLVNKYNKWLEKTGEKYCDLTEID